MTYDPSRHHRRSIRLPGYDYSQPGAYFVTICVEGREHLLGDVVEGVFQPNRFGHIVRAALTSLPRRYPHIRLDAFVIMPNHVHVVVETLDGTPADTGAFFATSISLGPNSFFSSSNLAFWASVRGCAPTGECLESQGRRAGEHR